MLNQVVLVGRIKEEIENIDNKFSELTLAVQSSEKDEGGDYIIDYVPCLLSGTIANTTKEYCKEGDIVGIKGKISLRYNEVVVITEKVTFLSTNKKGDE